jgi:hypothetical protein
MKKFIWIIRCTYYFMKHTNSGFAFGWYLASAWANEFDWQDYHPRDAMLEEVSCWDNDGD